MDTSGGLNNIIGHRRQNRAMAGIDLRFCAAFPACSTTAMSTLIAISQSKESRAELQSDSFAVAGCSSLFFAHRPANAPLNPASTGFVVFRSTHFDSAAITHVNKSIVITIYCIRYCPTHLFIAMRRQDTTYKYLLQQYHAH
jgi:hypothetical protein